MQFLNNINPLTFTIFYLKQVYAPLEEIPSETNMAILNLEKQHAKNIYV